MRASCMHHQPLLSHRQPLTHTHVQAFHSPSSIESTALTLCHRHIVTCYPEDQTVNPLLSRYPLSSPRRRGLSHRPSLDHSIAVALGLIMCPQAVERKSQRANSASCVYFLPLILLWNRDDDDDGSPAVDVLVIGVALCSQSLQLPLTPSPD